MNNILLFFVIIAVIVMLVVSGIAIYYLVIKPRQLKIKAKATGKTVEQVKLEEVQASMRKDCEDRKKNNLPFLESVNNVCPCIGKKGGIGGVRPSRTEGQFITGLKCNKGDSTWVSVKWPGQFSGGLLPNDYKYKNRVFDGHTIGNEHVFSKEIEGQNIMKERCNMDPDCAGFTWTMKNNNGTPEFRGQLKSKIPPVEQTTLLQDTVKSFSQGTYVYELDDLDNNHTFHLI